MRLIKWFCRPTRLVGLALLLVVAGLALGVLARWKAALNSDPFTQRRQAVRLDPGSAAADRQRTRLLLSREHWEEAVIELNAALQNAPQDAELYVLRAETYAEMGRYHDRPAYLERSIADADEALRLDPDQALAYCQRAMAYSAKFEDEKSLADAEEAVRRKPSDAHVFFTRGRVRADRGEDAKAVLDLSQAIHLDPKHARAFALRGMCRFELHEDAAALADCNRAVELAADDGWVYRNRAKVYREDRRYAKELADLNRALELNPRDLSCYFQRAICRAKQHDIRRAFTDCSSALEINPDSSATMAVRSLCHLARGRKKKAVADMEQAVRLSPANPTLHLLSAAFYQELNEPEKAIAACDLALNKGENLIARMAHLLRAVCFLQKGDIQRSSADCDQALKLDPKSVEAYALRSVVSSKAGDLTRSRSDFDAALKLDREKAYQFRAEALDMLKMNPEAIADWTELSKIAPKEAGSYQARAADYLAPLLEPAAMGVGVAHNALIIGQVFPNMPAAKAGVLVGDRIVRVGSLQPTQFNQVADHVSSFLPGATLEMEIERNGKRKVFRIILAARPLQLDNPNLRPGKSQAERAIADCKKAIELEPDDLLNHRLLAVANSFLDRHEEAIRSATEAIRLDPDDPEAHLLRAASYLERKEHEKAIADANVALRQEFEGGRPYLLRGLAYAGLRNEVKAKADLAEAARIDPKLAELQEVYNRQLAQERAAAPPQLPVIDFQIPRSIIPEYKSPFERPDGKQFQPRSSGIGQVFLLIGAAIILIVSAACSRKAKAR